MQNSEKEVKEQDFFIKNQTKKLREALDKTVSLDSIDEKMEIKLIRYFNKEHKKSFGIDKQRNPQSQINSEDLNDTAAIFSDIKYRSSEKYRSEH